MKKYSLTKTMLGTSWISPGVLASSNGSFLKGFECEPMPSGVLEESFEGPISNSCFTKLSDLLTKLPNGFEGQILLSRRKLDVRGFQSKLYVFETVKKAEGYSHISAVLNELKFQPKALDEMAWRNLLVSFFGEGALSGRLPDITWEKNKVRTENTVIRTLSLTELPQLTWQGCFQSIFEYESEFLLSLHFEIPDRAKIKRQLETKRRVSHALAISSSLEVKNIESNSVLSSSEETLERILVGKETLFEISLGILVSGESQQTLNTARDFERVVSGIGNAGLFLEGVGTMPLLRSHIPGNKPMSIRKLPILSENLAQILPLFHDYSRVNDWSNLDLLSRSGEKSHLNLFSKENLNFNAFICGASGSGKSFLMNAILTNVLKDEPTSRLCIFDVGGSYRRIIESNGGKCVSLSFKDARELISTFLQIYPVNQQGFYRAFIETLCGSGPHITHSHSVAIDDLLREINGQPLKIGAIIENANRRQERFYLDISHWLKPFTVFDEIESNPNLIEVLNSTASAFDFKELDSDPVLQKTTILLLSELLWKDLLTGKYSRTLIVFDEVWRFFAQSKSFLEEMYRTLRKYKAGIVSITQNLADYGDEAFAKMIFTNSFTKIFLQNGAAAEFLRETFDLPESDIERALSVTSRKPHYSEFFALSPNMSQVFRLYPTKEFYSLANSENISIKKEKE